MNTGTVKWFDTGKGYGFISNDNGGDDVIGGDDVTGGDDNTDNNGGSTSTPSFLEQLFAMIMQVLSRIFEFLPVGEVA